MNKKQIAHKVYKLTIAINKNQLIIAESKKIIDDCVNLLKIHTSELKSAGYIVFQLLTTNSSNTTILHKHYMIPLHLLGKMELYGAEIRKVHTGGWFGYAFSPKANNFDKKLLAFFETYKNDVIEIPVVI